MVTITIQLARFMPRSDLGLRYRTPRSNFYLAQDQLSNPSGPFHKPSQRSPTVTLLVFLYRYGPFLQQRGASPYTEPLVFPRRQNIQNFLAVALSINLHRPHTLKVVWADR